MCMCYREIFIVEVENRETSSFADKYEAYVDKYSTVYVLVGESVTLCAPSGKVSSQFGNSPTLQTMSVQVHTCSGRASSLERRYGNRWTSSLHTTENWSNRSLIVPGFQRDLPRLHVSVYAASHLRQATSSRHAYWTTPPLCTTTSVYNTGSTTGPYSHGASQTR